MYNPDEECDKLVEILKYLCRIKGISQYELAKKAGISSSALNELINGKTRPQVYTLFKICNALEISMGELFSEFILNEDPVSMGNESIAGVDLGTCFKITLEEKEFLFSYRRLDGRKKEILRVHVDMLMRYGG